MTSLLQMYQRRTNNLLSSLILRNRGHAYFLPHPRRRMSKRPERQMTEQILTFSCSFLSFSCSLLVALFRVGSLLCQFPVSLFVVSLLSAPYGRRFLYFFWRFSFNFVNSPQMASKLTPNNPIQIILSCFSWGTISFG